MAAVADYDARKGAQRRCLNPSGSFHRMVSPADRWRGDARMALIEESALSIMLRKASRMLRQ